MGLTKVALNFMVERGGKLSSSFLISKPVHKLDIFKLGICLSDGSLSFQTEKSAINYIKHRLVNSLNRPADLQFERGIFKEGKKILKEGDGDNKSCFVTLSFNKMQKAFESERPTNLEFWHSHPDKFGYGKTFPLSSPEGGDLRMFEALHLKKIVAVNRNGEINSIEIGKNFSQDLYAKFKKQFEKFYVSRLFSKEMVNRFKELKKQKKIFLRRNLEVPLKISDELNQIQKFGSKIEESPKAIQVLHEYYKKADKFGMKYFTDFSNL